MVEQLNPKSSWYFLNLRRWGGGGRGGRERGRRAGQKVDRQKI
jgi:hypothetical protein